MSMSSKTPYAEISAACLTFVVAVFLRLGWPGLNRFALDEANISLPALSMARGESFVFLGTFSSVSVPFFPAGTWLFVPPFLLGADPMLANVFIGLVNVGAVMALGWLVARRWGWLAGWSAALLLAASPYAVNFSRFIWQPNLMIPVTVLWLAVTTAALTRPTRRDVWAGGAVFVAGLAVQIHFALVGLVLATGIIALTGRWWRQWRGVLIGGILSAMLTVPYFWHIACCAPDVVNMARSTGDGALTVDAQSLRRVLDVLQNRDWPTLIVGDLAPGISVIEGALLVGVAALLIGGLAFGWRGAGWRGAGADGTQNQRRALVQIAVLLAVCMPLAFVVRTSPVNFYYMLPVLPLAAVMVGAGIGALRPLWARYMAGVLVVALSSAWVLAQANHMQTAYRTHTPNGINVPLWVTRGAAYAFPDERVIYHTHGDPITRSGQARIFQTFWYDMPQNRIINGAHLLILPPEPVVIMAELVHFQAWEEVQASGLLDGRDVIRFDARDGEPNMVAARYDGQLAPQGFQMLPDGGIAFEHGVTLEGWRVRYVGERLRVSTLWRVVDAMPNEVIQQFHHLYIAEQDSDAPFAVSDVALSVQTWQVGDRVIVMGDFFPEQDGVYAVAIGHYRLLDGVRYTYTDGDAVRLPEFDSADLR